MSPAPTIRAQVAASPWLSWLPHPVDRPHQAALEWREHGDATHQGAHQRQRHAAQVGPMDHSAGIHLLARGQDRSGTRAEHLHLVGLHRSHERGPAGGNVAQQGAQQGRVPSAVLATAPRPGVMVLMESPSTVTHELGHAWRGTEVRIRRARSVSGAERAISAPMLGCQCAVTSTAICCRSAFGRLVRSFGKCTWDAHRPQPIKSARGSATSSGHCCPGFWHAAHWTI